MVDFDDLLRLCRRDLREDTRVRRRPSAGGSSTCSSTSSRTSTRCSAACSTPGVGDRARPVRGGRPEPGHLRLERCRPRRAWPASPSTIPGAETIRLDRQLPLQPADPGRGQRRAGRRPARRPASRGPARPRCGPTGPTGPSPRSSSYPDDHGRGRRPSPASLRDHHRPGRSLVDPGRAVSHQRPGGADRAGAARHVASRSGSGGARGLLDQPEVKAALRDLQRHTGDLAVALTDLAGRRRARAGGGAGSTDAACRRRPAPMAPAADSRAANLEALARLGRDYLALESRPDPGRVRGLAGRDGPLRPARPPGRRRRAGHLPRGQGPRVADRAPGRPRAGPGAHRPRPHRRGPGRGAAAVLRGHHPGRAGAAPAPGPSSRTFGERTVDPSPLAVPRRGRDRGPGPAGRHGAGGLVRRTWAPSGPACGSRPRGRGPGARRAGAGRTSPAAAPDLDAAGQATFDALKAWRSRQAKAAAVPAYVIFHDRVLVEVAATRPGSRADAAGRAGHRRRSRSSASATRSWPSLAEHAAILNPCDSPPSSASHGRRWPRCWRCSATPTSTRPSSGLPKIGAPEVVDHSVDGRPRAPAAAPALHRRPARPPPWP